MEAIEFKTILHNGTVAIPAQYLSEWEGKTIRVIVLDESESLPEAVEQPTKTIFQAVSIETKGFDFSREEANVR